MRSTFVCDTLYLEISDLSGFFAKLQAVKENLACLISKTCGPEVDDVFRVQLGGGRKGGRSSQPRI